MIIYTDTAVVVDTEHLGENIFESNEMISAAGTNLQHPVCASLSTS